MFEQWLDPSFWPWWWRNRASTELKASLALVLLCASGLGGYVLAARVAGGAASGGVERVDVRARTVRQVVTVRRPGTPAFATRTASGTVTGPSVTRLVRTSVLRDRPVVRREVVTRAGRVRTVVEPAAAPVAAPAARTETVTSQQTVSSERVVTVTEPVTQVESRVVTTTQTVTVTQSETQTVTVGTTITVTLPLP